jgi:hypothetical protein
MEHAIMCPQCNAPLTPHRFARLVVCSYCGTTVQLGEASISAARFHEAFRVWNSPSSQQSSTWISIKDHHWVLDTLLMHGDISDVYAGRRARWPTELVIVKLVRDSQDIALLDNEWEILQGLQASNAPGADIFTDLLPQPVMHGDISEGHFAGSRVNIFRWASGFLHTFEEVCASYPQGIPARASIWAWRRILETLSFLHASGIVHGAVLPSHLLVQENEHGVRLIGYTAAGRSGDKLRYRSPHFESIYPSSVKSNSPLIAGLDLVMSARCMIRILGGDPAKGWLPPAVPKLLGETIKRVALADPLNTKIQDAWALRQELGEIASSLYGHPEFIPIVMPS